MTYEQRLAKFEERFKFLPDYDYILAWLIEREFFTAPASTKYHGSYSGGLFDHSLNVAETLATMTKRVNLLWERPESPWIVGMFHDLCKIDNYVAEPYGCGYDYNPCQLYKGHGDKSLMLLSSLLRLTEEEAACIRYHMGAFTEKEQWSDFTSAIHKFPNVLFTHTADMVAAHILEVKRYDRNHQG